jgi:hypothetical protein
MRPLQRIIVVELPRPRTVTPMSRCGKAFKVFVLLPRRTSRIRLHRHGGILPQIYGVYRLPVGVKSAELPAAAMVLISTSGPNSVANQKSHPPAPVSRPYLQSSTLLERTRPGGPAAESPR